MKLSTRTWHETFEAVLTRDRWGARQYFFERVGETRSGELDTYRDTYINYLPNILLFRNTWGSGVTFAQGFLTRVHTDELWWNADRAYREENSFL